MTILNDLRVFSVLLSREMRGMRVRFKDMCINGITIACTEALVYGYFMPKFGMPISIIPFIYIGAVMMFFTNIGATRLFKDSFDLMSNRFIDYQLTLPIPRFWLFASFLTAYIIELTVQAFFPLVLGMAFIDGNMFFSHINIGALLLIHAVSVTFCALFFLTFCYSFEYQWLIDHLWPRVLGPLVFLGAVYYPWTPVNERFPILGKLFLCNPFTYIVEGFRAAILSSSDVVSFEVSIAILALLCVVLLLTLRHSLKTKWDLV